MPSTTCWPTGSGTPGARWDRRISIASLLSRTAPWWAARRRGCYGSDGNPCELPLLRLVPLPPRLPVSLHVLVVGALGGGRGVGGGIGEAAIGDLRQRHRIELGHAV